MCRHDVGGSAAAGSIDSARALGRRRSGGLAAPLRRAPRAPFRPDGAAARFLAAVLEREGIASEIVELMPGRASLIARVRGSGADRPLCLVSHIDVVTAEDGRWPPGRGPLSGAVVVDPRTGDEVVWGRGALDMKGMGVLELYTLVLLRRLELPFDALALDRLLQDPATRALVTNTVSLTGFPGALQPNVVPSRVSAQYDVRLLPGTSPEAMLASLRETVRAVPGISIEQIDSAPAAVSPWDDPLFEALAHHAASGLERTVAGPTLSPGFTDSVHLRKKGVRAYGIVPFVLDRAEAATVHGDGERVSKRDVERGLRASFSAVVDVSLVEAR